MRKAIRSFLFVPAGDERLVLSAAAKHSDVVILDLEDGTHANAKETARQALPACYARLSQAGKMTAVRVNGDLLTVAMDLRAAVWPGLDLLVLPKVEHARDVQVVAQAVAALEHARGLVPGRVRFLLQIESVAALPRLHDIAAAHPRVMGMMLGSEDFSLDCGALPTPDSLLMPSLQVLYAARAAGIQPIGFVASIANLGTVEAFREVLNRARDLGFRGAVVVHPKFVDAVNDCYTATAEQLAHAQAVVAAFEAADKAGRGAVRVGDLMVDKPVYWRAMALLRESGPPDAATRDVGLGVDGGA